MRKVGLSDLFLSDYMAADGVKFASFGGIDSYTKLMLHMNGADSSTIFTDSEITPKTPTRYGDTQIKTAQSVFDGASGYFDGIGDYLSIANSTDWDFGIGDFTIDFRWRREGAMPTNSGAVSGSTEPTGKSTGWQIGFYGGGSIAAWLGGSVVLDAGAYADLTWIHVAVVRSGTNFIFFKNGISAATATSSASINSNGAGVVIGRSGVTTNDFYCKGYIDELRISKGIARWTVNFTPPSSPYSL